MFSFSSSTNATPIVRNYRFAIIFGLFTFLWLGNDLAPDTKTDSFSQKDPRRERESESKYSEFLEYRITWKYMTVGYSTFGIRKDLYFDGKKAWMFESTARASSAIQYFFSSGRPDCISLGPCADAYTLA